MSPVVIAESFLSASGVFAHALALIHSSSLCPFKASRRPLDGAIYHRKKSRKIRAGIYISLETFLRLSGFVFLEISIN